MNNAQEGMPVSGLFDFQRATVQYVLEKLYDNPNSSGRFLVADEVGLGKTLVARGVASGAVARLEHDDDVDRIDIVDICSNADIARQNLAKLNVFGSEIEPTSTRLTMLATQPLNIVTQRNSGQKPVNLVPFTDPLELAS